MTDVAGTVDIAAFDRILSDSSSGAFLLDVRNSIEAQRWKPEGPGLRGYLNVPYFEFIEDEDNAFARLPAAPQVLVLCAKGGSSDYVANVLRERGLQATNIAGGMISWAQHHRFVQIGPPDEEFEIYQVIRPAKGCLSYMIVAGDEAIAVDCSRYDAVYRDFAQRKGARIVATIDTHLHADHVSGGAALATQSQAPYHLAGEDAQGCTLPREEMPRRFTAGKAVVDVLTLPVPGHTLGSTALLVNGRYLISGDTLLPDSVGRPDLGNKAREWTGYLFDSLSGVLGRLDPNVAVLPAHAASAKQYDVRGSCVRRLGDLLDAQPVRDRGAFVDSVERLVAQTTQPAEYAQVRRVNLGQSASAQEIEELEIGVNQCALSSAKV